MKATNLRSGPAEKESARSNPPANAGSDRSRDDSGLKIPPILFEGDEPEKPIATGAGQKFAVGPEPAATVKEPAQTPEAEELPEAYGTQKLLLMARDPHWLYAHWDFTNEQLRRYNGLSAQHHLAVRVYEEQGASSGAVGTGGPTFSEVQVHPESRHWFVHVEKAGTKYVAELGYYGADQKWVAVATSEPAATPADQPSEERKVEFGVVASPQVLDPHVPSHPRPLLRGEVENQQVEAFAKAGGRVLAAPRYALIQGELFEQFGNNLLGEGIDSAHQDYGIAAAADIANQDRLIAQEMARLEALHKQVGSIEILELLGREIPWSAEVEGISSPLGGLEQKGFWLNVEAELIVYGGTEPDARVTIGGEPIQLRPDGTFSYRLALPDGEYELLVQAVSEGGETRQAKLRFRRCTERS